VLFRNESFAPTAEFSIPGYPDGAFELTVWDSAKKIEVEGNTIRRKIAIPFDPAETVKIVEIHRRALSNARWKPIRPSKHSHL
jgi:hypothetical protein